MSAVEIVLAAIGSIVVAIGLYCITADFCKIPTFNTSKAISNVSKKQKENTGMIDVWFNNISESLSQKIRMNEFKRQSIAADLKSAKKEITPERYIAEAVVYGAMFVVISIPFYFIIPLVGGILTGLGFILYFLKSHSLKGLVGHRREEIEKDLPRLVSTVQKKLSYERGILNILESFIPACGPELREELEITCADIRSGNEEEAVSRLEARVGSPMMSDVCRGFITMIHGDRAEAYWQGIEQKFSDIARARLKAKALKAPDKMRFIMIALLCGFMAIFVAALGVTLKDSLGLFF